MAASYPAALVTSARLDTTISPTDPGDGTGAALSHSGLHVATSEEIIAIEDELGVAPRGSYADLATRLQAVQNVRKTADQTFSSTTLANVTDLSFAIAASTDYTFEFFLPHTTGAAMGSAWALTISGTNTRIYYVAEIFGHGTNSNTGTDASVTQVATAAATKLQNAPTAGLTSTWAEVRGMLQQGAGAGTLQLQASRGAGATAVNVVVLKGALGRLTAV